MRKPFDLSKINKSDMLYDSRALWLLILPVMAEQFLNSLMGLFDTMMVSRVGAVAMSAVSLSDSINTLVIQVFAALATGGAIVCSHNIGRGDEKAANDGAKQVTLVMFISSVVITIFCLITRRPLLSLIFGQVEPEVMEDALVYFALTAASYPFLALFSSGSAFFRACGNTRLPMVLSIISNIMNVALNGVFIFGFGWGVMGAALATLASRVFSMVAIHIYLAKPKQAIVLKDYLSIRPDRAILGKILSIGIPSGIENGMFQFGKLAIWSSVSTLGTTAIAAQSMTNIFETVNGVCAQGVGIASITVVGTAFGAGRKEEGKYYIAKMTGYGMVVMLVCCLATYWISDPIMVIAGMEEEAMQMTHFMLFWITIVKPLFWCGSFNIPNGLRACGDVKFTMTVSVCTMWLCRVLISICLIRMFGFGPIAVWIGMFADWFIRACIFTGRYLSGKYMKNLEKVT